MTRRALAAITLGALLAGCGGDDGPSKDEFTMKASAICEDLNRELAPLQQEIARVQTNSDQDKVFADLARTTKRSVVVSEPYLGKLDALETPGDDRDRLKSWIADGRRQLALLTDLSHALAAKDQAQIAKVSEQIDELTTGANAFARSYGMPRCGQRR